MAREVGVVIPCKNEETTLARCLTALREQRPAPVRIVVVDNGSTDASLQIAQSLADQVLRIPSGTIAGLRNAGAAAVGEVAVLAFVDGDCEVAPGWMAAALDRLEHADLVGARMLADPSANWVARRWAAIEAAGAHLGSQVWSGHMAINRSVFDQVGGFDSRLGSGEDSDLGLRVRAVGGPVQQVPEMVAVHHGFPGTLRAFWRRERWHSRTPGWFRRMSGRSRVLVSITATWIAALVPVGGGAALAGDSWRWAVPVAGGWVMLTAVGIPLLGAVAGGHRHGVGGPGRLTHAVQDGILLGLWTVVRVGRLPGEVVQAQGR